MHFTGRTRSNDSFFVAFDQETFSEHRPIRGRAKSLNRGLINLRCTNVFIPRDTHKRHLNTDWEIIRVLTKHPTIRVFFDRWCEVYKALSSSDEVKRLIGNPFPQAIDPEKNDHCIPFSQTGQIDPARRKSARPPKSVPEPKVNLRKTAVDSEQIKLSLGLEEARTVCSYFGIVGRADFEAAEDQLAGEIKAAILLNRRNGGPR